MPTLGLLQQIEKDFGSFTNFKEKFTEAALTLFGSGWVWLVCKFCSYNVYLLVCITLQLNCISSYLVVFIMRC